MICYSAYSVNQSIVDNFFREFDLIALNCEMALSLRVKRSNPEF